MNRCCTVARGRGRIRPSAKVESVVQRIIEMRDMPPEGLRRTPGPKALLYYLPRDERLQGERLPRSSRTIYGILKQAGRIAQRLPHLQEELERPAPMSRWQLDAEGRCHGARRSRRQAAARGRSAQHRG